jgi:uncharacterized surface protein with fasciclin (FAS1) repeats
MLAAGLMIGSLAACAGAAHHKGDGHSHGEKKAMSAKRGPNLVEVAASNEAFSTLVTAVKEAGLVETLSKKGPYTIFAPSNEAFAKLPKGALEGLLKDKAKLTTVLLHHVVPGKVNAADVVKKKSVTTAAGQTLAINTKEGVQLGEATVVKTDVAASNGVIHVIDEVLMPGDIVDVAAADKRFATLVAAVKAAGLVETLKGDGPFTVFAPTNAAFEKLPDGTVQSLLAPANKGQLTDILTYHVVPGRVTAEQVVGRDMLPTVQGGRIDVTVDGKSVMVDGAKVVKTDIRCMNGVIHVIDAVIMP